MVAEKKQRVKRSTAKQPEVIPDYLICEIMDGQPLYYKGYKDVLKRKKKIEDIMGSSSLQGILVTYLIMLMGKHNLDEQYNILSSESGLHLNTNNNLAGDIVIYDPSVLTPDKINKHYADVPPKVVIEVDIMIELENQKDYQYVKRKVDKLHNFGTEKVIWIMTYTKQVIVAVPGQPWQVYDWKNNIDILDNVHFNIGNYLQAKGIVVDE